MIGAFINISAVTAWLMRTAAERGHAVLGLEEQVLPRGHAVCRRADGADCWRRACSGPSVIRPRRRLDLWSLAEGDVLGYMEKAAQRHRLKRLGLDDVIPYSFDRDRVEVVPVFDGKVIKGEL